MLYISRIIFFLSLLLFVDWSGTLGWCANIRRRKNIVAHHISYHRFAFTSHKCLKAYLCQIMKLVPKQDDRTQITGTEEEQHYMLHVSGNLMWTAYSCRLFFFYIVFVANAAPLLLGWYCAWLGMEQKYW